MPQRLATGQAIALLGKMLDKKNPCFGWEAGICKLLERVVKYITVECPFIIPPEWVR